MTDDNLISLSEALSILQKSAAQTTQSTAEFIDAIKSLASTGARLSDVVAIDTAKVNKYKTLQYKHEVSSNGNVNS